MVASTVDLSKVIQPTTPYAIGVGSSTYGASPLTSTAQADSEKRLDARFVRIPVKWNGSSVVSSAAGSGQGNMKGLVDLYRSWGYRCIIVIAGRDSDFGGYQNGDAAAIIRSLGTTGLDYSAPNEPNNGGFSIQDELNRAIQIYNEFQPVAAGTKVWGPVWSYYNRNDNKTFAQGMGVARLGGVDYHHYAMGTNSISTSQAMSETPVFGREVADTRADLRSLGLPEKVNVDELNFSWRYNDGTDGGNNNRFFKVINTVWIASALGHIAKNGGAGMVYATQNGPLGVMVEGGSTNPDNRPASSPMPAFWGLATFTGAHIWPHYKDAFYSATSDDSGVEIFALNNEAGGYNLIVLNKAETAAKDIMINLLGVGAGNYDLYQTRASNPYDPPVKIVTDGAYTASLGRNLPPMSANVFVLRPGGVTPPPVDPPPVVTAKTTWRVNVGSGAVTGWESAADLVTGGTSASNAGTTIPPTGVPEAVFDTERYGNMTFKIPVSGTEKVRVKLLFSERYTGAQSVGARQFNVAANGAQVATNYDVWVKQGSVAGKAAVLTTDVAPSGGFVTIALSTGAAGGPFINGFMIDPITVTPPPVDPPPADPLVLPIGATLPQTVAAHNALVATLRAKGIL